MCTEREILLPESSLNPRLKPGREIEIVSHAPVHHTEGSPERHDDSGNEEPQQKEQQQAICSRVWLCCRVVGVYLASVLASGMLAVWPVVQPHFVAEGVFAELCKGGADTTGSSSEWTCHEQDAMLSQAYLLGANVLLVGLWPQGIIFDSWGARRTTILGCMCCCAGSAGLAFAASRPAHFSWVLFPGVVLTDVGSTMNSFGLYGFLWHFHDRQGFLSGLANSTYSVSCMLPLAFLQIFPFKLALWLSTLNAACALLLCVLFVPTSAEYFAKAEDILGGKFEAPGFDLLPVIRSCRKVFQAHCRDNSFFTVSLLFMICSYQYYTAIAYPFLVSLLKSNTAATQVTLAGSEVYSVLGFFLSPFAGCLTDWLGMKILIVSMTVLSTIMAPLVFMPRVDLQMAGNVVSTLLSLLQGTYYIRWFALYAPPHMFGNFQGAVVSGCGLLSLAIQSLIQATFGSDLFGKGLIAFAAPLGILLSMSVMSGLVFCCHIMRHGVAERPPIVDDVVCNYEAVPDTGFPPDD